MFSRVSLLSDNSEKTEYEDNSPKQGMLNNFTNSVSMRNFGTYASSISFFFFISLIPMLVLLSSMLPMTGLDKSDLISAITSVTPSAVDSLVTDIVNEAYLHSVKLLPISIGMLVWASSSATLALMKGMNDVYGVREKRNPIRLIFISVFYTIVILMLMIGILLFMFGGVLYEFLQKHLSWIVTIHDFLTRSRLYMLVGIVVLVFSLLYTHLPAGKRLFIFQVPGAMFTTAVWAVFSWFFAKYINGVNKYTLFYGSFGAIAIFMFWLFCCFYIFLIGGFLNSFLENSWRKLWRKIKGKHDARKAEKIAAKKAEEEKIAAEKRRQLEEEEQLRAEVEEENRKNARRSHSDDDDEDYSAQVVNFPGKYKGLDEKLKIDDFQDMP